MIINRGLVLEAEAEVEVKVEVKVEAEVEGKLVLRSGVARSGRGYL